MRKGNLEYFVDKAMSIHGNKYGYGKVIENEPKSVKDKITVTCPTHGDFVTTFDAHVNKKCGCPLCNRGKRRTTETFIEECKTIHKDKNYDYSKTIFTSTNNKVTIICHNKNAFGDEHGEFQIRANHFLNGHGCPYCAKRHLTTADVIYNAKQVHGNKYDYSLVKYNNNNKERLPIICHVKDEEGVEHGVFTPVWYSHIAGVGCPKCNGGIKHTKEDFVKAAKEKHGELYGYDNFQYVNAITPGYITCYRHGDFLQTPYAHAKMGEGCPKCKSSKLEALLLNKFDKYDIDYEYQVSIDGLGNQTIDFYIPSKKIFIECQGEQHYMPIKFGNQTIDEVYRNFESIKNKDREKYEFVINKGCTMIYFTNASFFHESEVDIYGGFYKGKIVFENTEDVLKYVEGINGDVDDDLLTKFRNDLRNISKSIVSYGRRFKYRNYLIYLNELKGDNKERINDTRRKSIKNGYKVLHIFEDEYINHRDIVLSKIKHILGFYEHCEKIPARKCVIKKVDNITANTFLNNNHIQGGVASTVYLGAEYNGNVVAIMSFTEESKGLWNLTRFATDNSYVCQGMGGKLLTYFIREYNPTEIKSFADRRWTCDEKDNLYIKLGFSLDKVLPSEYRYYKEGVSTEREHKFKFRKLALYRKYRLPLTMTENQMTKELGYVKIWDCGLFKYVWRNPKKIIVADEIRID